MFVAVERQGISGTDDEQTLVPGPISLPPVVEHVANFVRLLDMPWQSQCPPS